MKITQDEMWDSTTWKTIEDDITDHRRWCVEHTVVLERLEDHTFWKGSYDQGATENQDSGYDDDIELHQVWPHPTFTVVYLPTNPMEKKA
jgi:hypothetical protein